MSTTITGGGGGGIFSYEIVQKFYESLKRCVMDCLSDIYMVAQEEGGPLQNNILKAITQTLNWDNSQQNMFLDDFVEVCGPSCDNDYVFVGSQYVKLTNAEYIKKKKLFKLHLTLQPLKEFVYNFLITILQEDQVRNLNYFKNMNGMERNLLFQSAFRSCLIKATMQINWVPIAEKIASAKPIQALYSPPRPLVRSPFTTKTKRPVAPIPFKLVSSLSPSSPKKLPKIASPKSLGGSKVSLLRPTPRPGGGGNSSKAPSQTSATKKASPPKSSASATKRNNFLGREPDHHPLQQEEVKGKGRR